MALTPHAQAAAWFMARKGYPQIEPFDVEKLEGEPIWYYAYKLPEGDVLEIEVAWNEREWDTQVVAFNLDEEEPVTT